MRHPGPPIFAFVLLAVSLGAPASSVAATPPVPAPIPALSQTSAIPGIPAPVEGNCTLELGILDQAIHRVPHGRYILLPITPETRGHGTHSLPAIWGKYLAELLAAAGPGSHDSAGPK